MNSITKNPLKSMVEEIEKFDLLFNQPISNNTLKNYKPRIVYKKQGMSYLELKNQLIELMKELKANYKLKSNVA